MEATSSFPEGLHARMNLTSSVASVDLWPPDVHVCMFMYPSHPATHPQTGPVPPQKNRGQNGATSSRECTFGPSLPTVCSQQPRFAVLENTSWLLSRNPDAFRELVRSQEHYLWCFRATTAYTWLVLCV